MYHDSRRQLPDYTPLQQDEPYNAQWTHLDEV